MKKLEDKWEFLKYSLQVKKIERAVLSTDSSTRKENVAEHTYSMSLIFWIFKEDFVEEFPKLNVLKVYDLIQIHDIVEIIASDVSTWDHLDSSTQRISDEKEATKTISKLLSGKKRSEYLDLYDEYEKQETTESKLVKGIDRISPAIQRVITRQGWIKEGHSEQDLDNIQINKVKISGTLLSLYNILKLEAKEQDLL